MCILDSRFQQLFPKAYHKVFRLVSHLPGSYWFQLMSIEYDNPFSVTWNLLEIRNVSLCTFTNTWLPVPESTILLRLWCSHCGNRLLEVMLHIEGKQGWCEICWCYLLLFAADSWSLRCWTSTSIWMDQWGHSSDSLPCTNLTLTWNKSYILTWWIAYLKQSFFKLIFLPHLNIYYI